MARQPDPKNDQPASSGPKPESGSRKQLVTGAAIGIGSAALVAALLYANRARKADKS